MKDLLALFAHLMATLAILLGRGGVKAVLAQNLLLKQQLLIINRPRRRGPDLGSSQRLLLAFWSLFLNPRRILRSAVILSPSTLLRFHKALKAHKYRWLILPAPAEQAWSRTVRKLAFEQEIDENPAVSFSCLWCGEAKKLASEKMKSDHAAVIHFQLILICLAGWINHNHS